MSFRPDQFQALAIAALAVDDESPWYASAIKIGGLVLVIWIVFELLKRKDDFRITVRRGQVEFHGKFPPDKRADTAEFLLHEVAPAGTMRVTGNWSPGRVLRVGVQGKISTGEIQRIRNFLKFTLKG